MELYTIQQAAQYLGIHKETLRKMDRDGIFYPQQRIGAKKHRRYTKEALDAFKERCATDNHTKGTVLFDIRRNLQEALKLIDSML